MLLLYLALYFRALSALLLSTDNRISIQNISCQHGLGPPTPATLVFNCEACLISSRNYDIETSLSLTGSGPTGLIYTCLKNNDVEAYHENLVRECRYFPKDTLNGYDDFCIASPYTFVRGSYRACICITNGCNSNYSQCLRQTNPNRDTRPPSFSNTIKELTNRVKCYRPYEDYNQPTYSNLPQLCSNTDEACKDYIYDNGVLCLISVDKTNQIARQTLTPSIYSSYLIKYKTQFCNTYIMTSKSISFSQCQLEDSVCMCAVDDCNKDLETCRTTNKINKNSYSVYILLLFIFNIYI